jgi:hypothetical protein
MTKQAVAKQAVASGGDAARPANGARPASGARPVSGARGASGQSSGSWRWLQGLGCGALVTLAAPTALLGGVLLAPSVLAWVMDALPNRPVAKPILLFGLAAAAQPIATLWHLGHGMDVALALLDQPATLAACWAAQAGGWLAVELIPIGLTLVLDQIAQRQAARLRAARAVIMDEWDISTDA